MKKIINLKHIILFIMVFSALLFCVSSVCAQDINATDNIADLNNNDNNINNNINNNIDIVKNHIIDEENETLENQNADNLTAEGTFDDFQSEINKASEGSVLNLTRDYIAFYIYSMYTHNRFCFKLNKRLYWSS